MMKSAFKKNAHAYYGGPYLATSEKFNSHSLIFCKLQQQKQNNNIFQSTITTKKNVSKKNNWQLITLQTVLKLYRRIPHRKKKWKK